MEKCNFFFKPLRLNLPKKDRLTSPILDQTLTNSNVFCNQFFVSKISTHSTDPYGYIWPLNCSDFLLFHGVLTLDDTKVQNVGGDLSCYCCRVCRSTCESSAFKRAKLIGH